MEQTFIATYKEKLINLGVLTLNTLYKIICVLLPLNNRTFCYILHTYF